MRQESNHRMNSGEKDSLKISNSRAMGVIVLIALLFLFQVVTFVVQKVRMRQVAEETGLHISTVSRTVRGKYMECPCGLLELRSFFSGRLGTAAEGVSAKSARAVLAEILKHEDSRKEINRHKGFFFLYGV